VSFVAPIRFRLIALIISGTFHFDRVSEKLAANAAQGRWRKSRKSFEG
jgi:hypothetical protein